MPRAHHGHGQLIAGLECAGHAEQRRRVRNRPQPDGVGRIEPGHHGDAGSVEGLRLPCNPLPGLRIRLARQSPRHRRGHPDPELELARRGREHGLG